MQGKETQVMKRLYEQYTESLEKLMKRIEQVHDEQKSVTSKSKRYFELYNRRRRLMVMYEDTYRWREMVAQYLKAWKK